MRVSVVIFVLGLAAFLVSRRLRPAPATEGVAAAEPATRSTTVTQNLPSAAPVPPPETATAPNDRDFGQWLEREAERLDSPTGGEDQEAAMAAAAARLTPAQTRELLRTAKTPSAPASKKILSTYLLVQAGSRALTELRELVAAPIAAGGPAHSAAELDNARDKTLRLMALDGLSTHAKTDPAARAALASAVEEIEDPFVKERARERLRDL